MLFGADARYLAVNVAESQPGWSTAPMRWGAVYPYPVAAPYPLIDAEVRADEASPERARDTARSVALEAGVTPNLRRTRWSSWEKCRPARLLEVTPRCVRRRPECDPASLSLQ